LSCAVCLALAGAALAAYGPATANDFVNYDDEIYVTQNPNVEQGPSPVGAVWAFTTTRASNWHPLTWLSLQLDASLFRLCPFGFHLTNVLLHTANTILLYGLLLAMTGRQGPSLLVAALFGLHPLHVESVAWVAERKDVLSTLFWLLTMWAYWHYVQRPGLARYLGVALCLGLGLLAKPMLVTLPVILFLLDFWPLRREQSPAKQFFEKLPLLVLALAAGLMTIWAQHVGSAVGSLEDFPLVARLKNAAFAYLAYLGTTLWPLNLVPFYPHLGANIALWQWAPAVVCFGVATAMAWLFRARFPYLLVGWFWYVITLLPVIGILQVGLQAMADRYTYIPLIGIFILVVWAGAELAQRWHIPHVVIVPTVTVAVAACAVATWTQNGYWQDSLTLWNHALEIGTNNVTVQVNLGHVCDDRRQAEEALGHMKEASQLAKLAMDHYLEGTRLGPNNPEAHYNLGLSYAKLGQYGKAIAEFATAVRLRPNFVFAQHNLGLALCEKGAWEQGVQHFQLALQLQPNYALAHNSLGRAYLQRGDYELAADHFRQTIEIMPDFAMAHDNLGIVCCLVGKYDEAASFFMRAIKLDAKEGQYYYDLGHALSELGQHATAMGAYQRALELNSRLPGHYNRVAFKLAASADARQRNGPMALRLAKQCCEATRFQVPAYLETLAIAHAALGQFSDAVRWMQQALEHTPSNDLAAITVRTELLKRFERHQPYRQLPIV
jgi:tetratricopeptide (TPR) repeat protein